LPDGDVRVTSSALSAMVCFPFVDMLVVV
jgi:hypothetical protein